MVFEHTEIYFRGRVATTHKALNLHIPLLVFNSLPLILEVE